MTIRDMPYLTKVCELLVCDNIPAQMDRSSILLSLLDISVQGSEYKWEHAERELMTLTEDELDDLICGEEGSVLVTPETRDVLEYIWDEMNKL